MSLGRPSLFDVLTLSMIISSYENDQSKKTYLIIDEAYEPAARRVGLSKEGDFWVLRTQAKSAIGAIEQVLRCRVVLTEEQREWIAKYVAYRMERSTRAAIADGGTNLETQLSAVMSGTLICVKEDASAPRESLDALKQQLDAHQNGGAVAVLYGSDNLEIGKLCREAWTEDGPVMEGMVKGLWVVFVDQFDGVKSELETMQRAFRKKWEQ